MHCRAVEWNVPGMSVECPSIAGEVNTLVNGTSLHILDSGDEVNILQSFETEKKHLKKLLR